MAPQPIGLLILLTLLWFVLFWIIGGVIFATIGLVRFLRVNKNRFSCLFTFFSLAAAFGAAWTGIAATNMPGPHACLVRQGLDHLPLTQILPSLFNCSYNEVLSAAGLWFLFLLAVGIILLLISRTPEKPRDIHGNN
jgi:hypothetical protein